VITTGGDTEKNWLHSNASWGCFWCGCKHIYWSALRRFEHQDARGL